MAIGLDEYLKPMFKVPRVVNMYALVSDARRALDFNKPESDEAIRTQSAYVTQQYRKLVSSLEQPVMELARQDPDALLDELVERSDALDTYPQDVRSALYACVRDSWLAQLINAVDYWIQVRGEVDNPEGAIDV